MIALVLTQLVGPGPNKVTLRMLKTDEADNPATCRTDTKIVELVDYNEAAATAEWKLADVRQNRSGIPSETVQLFL